MRISSDTKVTVKKTFQLDIEGKNKDRVLEATKHEIRKYVKRQRRVALPAGVDWSHQRKCNRGPFRNPHKSD
jgi:HSP20 family molecular chaperone IbpA